MRFLCLPLLCFQALAYNPPADTAGPLTVSMQPAATGTYGAGGYADLSLPNVPFVVPVTLQNSSDREISGTLRLAVVDQWKVDPAGAVAFRLGYADLSRPNVPFVVPVTLQNSSDREISGTLRLAVVDQWKVDPAGAVAFRLGPRGRSRQEFTLTFGPGTLSAQHHAEERRVGKGCRSR